MMIIKIGGGESINIRGIIADLAEVSDPFVIIHGANALRDQIAQELKKPKKVITSLSGYSSVFSDQQAIDLLMMAYAGLRNKRIVELCQQYGINAVGLSGLDGKMIQGRRNTGIRIKENEKLKIVRDYSGKPQSINLELLQLLIKNHYIPVLCIPIIDQENFAINSENDDIVNVLHEALKSEMIFQFIEAPGFLLDSANPDSLVKNITAAEIQRLEEQVEGRMKRKMLALRKLCENANPTVFIADGRVEHPFKEALAGKGTVIK